MSKPFARDLLNGSVRLIAEHGQVILAFPAEDDEPIPAHEYALTAAEAMVLSAALSQFAREAGRQGELAAVGKHGRP
ncbi:MAG TPA: hypothetical protein VHM23_28340 [Actinomycetota bacterium]|nr:hypothetical protein [Actinomycetota bacterium]